MGSHTQSIANLCTAVLLAVLVALSGCSDATAPQIERLGSFRLLAPTTIAAGETVTLTIEAVGTEGTQPFADFNGDVSLAASVGEVTPDVVTLIDGRATVDIALSASAGVVQLSASGASAAGTIAIDVSALTALPGDASDNASASIPDLDYAPSPADFDDAHPDLAGLSVSLSTVLINFTPGATVGGANEMIARIGGLIVGGIPGVSSGRGGMLMLRVPTGDHEEMDAMLAALESEAAIELVGRDIAYQLTFVPNSGEDLTEWTWQSLPVTGNWGMEMCRMPQMWNLNSAIAKRGDPTILTGIIDSGFAEHSDLAFRRVAGSDSHRHGTHVAGTIAAGFNNERGVDGVTPFAQLHVVTKFLLLSTGTTSAGVMKLAGEGCRVINHSIGIEWASHPDNSPLGRSSVRRNAEQLMKAFEPLRDAGIMPLLVPGAANDSDKFATAVDARYGSALNFAALELGFGDIIVVEAIEVEDDGRRLAMSNFGGHVSAPGGKILSTVPGDAYGLSTGTSMAAPHVTGLASFLLSIDPSLTNAELISLITNNTKPTSPNSGVAASPRIDGFAAALAIDGLRGGDEVVRMLIDVDDGTPDGNLRVNPSDPNVDFTDADADGDGGIGDGRIDMSDFRRWRDWLHQTKETSGAVFDGSATHLKHDVNGDRLVESPSLESIYPRADFNGDGELALSVASIVPGESPIARTDLQMIARHIDDPQFTEAILIDLIRSGDVYVDLSQYVNSGRFNEVTSEVRSSTGELIEFHEHTAGAPAYVYTLVSGESYQLAAWGISGTDTLCTNTQEFSVGLCSDAYWLPECSGVRVEITMAQRIEPGSASPLLVRAGVLDANGDVVYQAGIQLDISATGGSVAATSGTTDTDGFFDTEVTMGASSPQLNVFVTATDPSTGESAVAHATAVPLGDASVVLTAGDFFVNANASTKVQSSEPSNDGDFTREFFPPATGLSAGHSAGASSSDPDQGWSATASSSASISAEATMSSGSRMTGAQFTGNASASGSVTGSPGCCSAFALAGGHMLLEFDVETPVLATLSSQGNSGLAFLGSSSGAIIVGNGQAVLPPGSYRANFTVSPDQSTGSGSITATLTFSRPPVSASSARR